MSGKRTPPPVAAAPKKNGATHPHLSPATMDPPSDPGRQAEAPAAAAQKPPRKRRPRFVL
jgi:hypothetical protein